MESKETKTVEKWSYSSLPKNSTGGFSVVVVAILQGLSGDKYIQTFRKYNIGRDVLPELSNEDLIILGVDCYETRNKMLIEFKCLPPINSPIENFRLRDGIGILQDVAQHLHRIKLSLTINRIRINKDTKHVDALLLQNCFTSDVILKTINKMDTSLETMEKNLCTMKTEPYKKKNSNLKHKKMVIGVTGIIIILSICLVKSLKDL